jgi:uncharacterized protein (TIGR00369 family)
MTTSPNTRPAHEGPAPQPGSELVQRWMSSSPFAGHLGLQVAAMDADRAEITLPYAESNATMGDMVHGGAISALVDVAATCAAWTEAEISAAAKWGTVGLTVDFVRAARGTDLHAKAKVVRRGRSLCFCDVDVVDSDDTLIARGLVTYKVG